ncbi:MAG TPA: type IV pilus modification protein PilV [Burkholderiaceae bacterium]|jgi:type IV pilus assembly protein PilV
MRKNIQSGFYLLETLVSVFVVSIGVLCAAGMQLTAMQTAQQSGLQTLAMQLAVDMADQIRANNSVTKLNDEQNPYLSIDYGAAKKIAAPSAQCFSAKNICSTIEMENFSIYGWEKKIKENLPQGRMLVCRDAEPWDSNASRYRWECNSTPNGNSSLVIKIGWYEKKSQQSISNDRDKNYPPLIALVVGI